MGGKFLGETFGITCRMWKTENNQRWNCVSGYGGLSGMDQHSCWEKLRSPETYKKKTITWKSHSMKSHSE